MEAAGLDIEHAQRRPLITSLGRAVRDQRTVARRVVPVDGDGGVGREGRRIEHDAPGHRLVVGRAHDERELGPAAGSLQREDPVAGQAAAGGHSGAQERDEALVPLGPIGPGIERLTGSIILRRRPRDGLGGFGVLEPAVGVRHRHAVQQIDDVVAPGHRRRRQHVVAQPRPMLGRLPWFALLRRVRAFFFLVFFDMSSQPTRCEVPGTTRYGVGWGRRYEC